MADTCTLRWEVVSLERLRALADAPLPGVRPDRVRRSLHRDIHVDTTDEALRRRGIACRLRISADDRRELSLEMDDAGVARRVRVQVRALALDAALREDNPVTRRLLGIVDPERLSAALELEVDRVTRSRRAWWQRRPALEVHYDVVTVRRAGTARTFYSICAHAPAATRGALVRCDEAMRLAGAYPAAMSRAQRAELLLKWMPTLAADGGTRGSPTRLPEEPANDGTIDPEVSFLASQLRVLEIADDPATPLAERLRFIAIVAANVDEFFAVRVAGLKLAVPELVEESRGGGAPVARRQVIRASVHALTAAQQRSMAGALDAAAAHGVRLRAWSALTAEEARRLSVVYREALHAELTPLAMTLSPGHPIPHLATQSLSMAVLLRDAASGARHVAQVDLPDGARRFVPVAEDGTPRDGVVLVEEVVRPHVAHLYPGSIVEEARCFRVTRGGELAVDEERTGDLLAAVDDATRRRIENGIVRLEIEPATSPVLRDLLLEELRRESRGATAPLDQEDVYEVDGPLDLRAATALPLPPDAALHFPAFEPADPAPGAGSLLEVIGERDLLVHHPFESFTGSVVRFIREAADDPDVSTIRMTLYRVGDRSPIVEALRDAARHGKQVFVFVELRARFDEERNVKWVRTLEKAGAHVIYGLRGVKTHAKAALVVRREGGRMRRYAHVGTGNYNPQSGACYTDLSLFTADGGLTADVLDLFNVLTGASRPAAAGSHGALIAPTQLLPALLDRIEREAMHARAGRPAAIRIKVNGLSDPDVVQALARASQAGVRVELAVRGICTLRPDAPGESAGIRVVAHAGRFLEHSRIYHFANAGTPEWYIGSADLRTRNLRRRVELLVPVRDAHHQATLDELLTLYLEDPCAWELVRSGAYVRRRRSGPGAQEVLLHRLASGPAANPMSDHGLTAPARVDFTGSPG